MSLRVCIQTPENGWNPIAVGALPLCASNGWWDTERAKAAHKALPAGMPVLVDREDGGADRRGVSSRAALAWLKQMAAIVECYEDRPVILFDILGGRGDNGLYKPFLDSAKYVADRLPKNVSIGVGIYFVPGEWDATEQWPAGGALARFTESLMVATAVAGGRKICPVYCSFTNGGGDTQVEVPARVNINLSWDVTRWGFEDAIWWGDRVPSSFDAITGVAGITRNMAGLDVNAPKVLKR